MHKNEDIFQSLSREQILSLRLKDLHFNLEYSWIYPHLKTIKSELKRKHITVEPKFYIGDDWFVADGNMAISIPFFLFSPKLIKLEREFMGFVDGLGPIQCQKVLRHEMGHLIDNAFKLRSHKNRQNLFGDSKAPYPDKYEYNPISKSYVRYLAEGYAQAHPDEDWAETFATWLDPNSLWREKYKNWECLDKLKILDKMMKNIKGQQPLLKSQKSISGIQSNSQTLKSYWLKKSRRQRTFHRYLDQNIPSSILMTKNSSVITKERSLLIKNISAETHFEEFKIRSIIKRIESYYENQGLYLNYKKLKPYLIHNTEELCKKGFHRVLM